MLSWCAGGKLRSLHVVLLALFALLPLGCAKPGSSTQIGVSNASGPGNADPVDGGDAADQMKSSLAQTKAALSLISSGYDTASLCDPTACPRDKAEAACNMIDQAKGRAGALNFVKAFLTSSDVIAQLQDKAGKTSIQIAERVEVNGVQKTAKTDPNGDGPIIVARLDAVAMSAVQRIGILTHEIGHKIIYPRPDGKIGDDVAPTSLFSRGDEFLNTAGACVAAYAVTHPSGPGAPDLEFSGGLQTTTVTKTYSEIVLADEPSLYLKLDEATGTVAHDSSPYGIDGTYYGGISLARPGGLPALASNSAVKFNGVDAYLEVKDQNNRQQGAVSAEMWCYVSQDDIQNSRLGCSVMAHENGDSNIQTVTTKRGFALYLNSDGRFYFQSGDAVTWPRGNVASGRVATPGWYHLVGVHNGSEHSLYVNGQRVATMNGGGYVPTKNPMWLGRNPDPGLQNEYHDGIIDEVATYNHGLTADQVAEHYAAGQAALSASVTAIRHQILPDGWLLVASAITTSTGSQVLLSRYAMDGTPDMTLNGTGRLLTSARVPANTSLVPLVAVSGDGSMYVPAPGVSQGSFALYRYDASGKADVSSNAATAYRDGGLSIMPTEFPSAILVQLDGKPVVAGTARVGSHTVGRIRRFLARSGGDVAATVSFTANNEGISAIALAADGGLMVTGIVDGNDNRSSLLFLRLTPALAVDTGFGAYDYLKNLDWGNAFNIGRAIAIDAAGKIYVAGDTGDVGRKNVGLMRFTPDGKLDAAFGSGGKTVSQLPAENETVSSLLIGSDGQIVVGGGATMKGHVGPLILRYGTDGNLDQGWNGMGALVERDLFAYLGDLGFDSWTVDSLGQTSQGRLMVGGHSAKAGKFQSYLLRLWY